MFEFSSPRETLTLYSCLCPFLNGSVSQLSFHLRVVAAGFNLPVTGSISSVFATPWKTLYLRLEISPLLAAMLDSIILLPPAISLLRNASQYSS